MFWRRSKINIDAIILTISILVGRATTFIFFVTIGNRFGVSMIADHIWAAYAPVAVIMSIISSVVDGVLLPVIVKAEKLDIDSDIFTYFSENIPKYILIFSSILTILYTLVTEKFNIIIIMLITPAACIYYINSLRSVLLNIKGLRNVVAVSPVGGFVLVSISFFILPVHGKYLAIVFLFFELGRFLALSIPFHGFYVKNNKISDSSKSLILKSIVNAKYQVVGVVAWSSNYLVDIWFASRSGIGGVALIEYANRIWLGVPLLFQGILLLFYIECAKRCKNEEVNVSEFAIKYGMVAGILSIFLFIYSKHIIQFLYGHGNVSPIEIENLSWILRCYVIGSGPYVAGLFYARSLFAKGKNIITAYVGIVGVVLNILLNEICVRLIGIKGIALSTSIALSLVTCFLAVYHFRISKQNRAKE